LKPFEAGGKPIEWHMLYGYSQFPNSRQGIENMAGEAKERLGHHIVPSAELIAEMAEAFCQQFFDLEYEAARGLGRNSAFLAYQNAGEVCDVHDGLEELQFLMIITSAICTQPEVITLHALAMT